MIKIKGTTIETFHLVMEDNYLAEGEVIEGGQGLMTVEKVSKYKKDFNYKISYPAMVGEELEIAVNHFKFLLKYGLVPF